MTASFVLEQSRLAAEALRYAWSSIIVVVAMAGGFALLGTVHARDDAIEAENAVLVDLPSSTASSLPKQDVEDGPTQQASQASAAVDEPPRTDQSKVSDLDTKSPPPDADEKRPPPPDQPQPDAVIERKVEAPAPPPEPITASASPKDEATAPSGSQRASPEKDLQGDGARTRASARAMSLWQRSMALRLQATKRFISSRAIRSGIVRIAFRIDRQGRLLSEWVDRGSGQPALDETALALVKAAAPYPAPPPSADESALNFLVPIRLSR